MAHAVELDEECSEYLCHKRATHEVRDRWNGKIRKCCKRHADLLVKSLKADGR